MRRFFITLILGQLLVSGLWAALPLAADSPAAFESPHLHLSLNFHSDHAGLSAAEAELEHEPENPIHLCFLALDGQPGWCWQSGVSEKTPFSSRIANPVLIPPVPPPNT